MLSSTVVMDGDEYSTNDNLQQDVLNFSDKGELEIELNKLESGVCLNPKRTPTRWADRILTVSLSDSVSQDTPEQQKCQNARLALLLELAHTRSGAKCIIYYNLFRSLEEQTPTFK
ncbi:Guanylate kinase [Fusarium oxysporum f. sp. albedinis]|nr:Guanylate kinase [Fusarium oxysporum f. sp. albedinis]